MSAIAFREPTSADARRILDWRTSPRVAARMLTRVAPDLARQTAWLAARARRDDRHHWLILIDGEPAGLLDVGPWDWARNTTAWGFYLGEERFLGLGGLVPPHLYNWLFFGVGLDRLTAEVLADNAETLDLHRYHGYRADGPEPTAERAPVRLRLERAAWLERRRLHRLRAEFPVRNPCPELARRLGIGIQDG